MTLKKKLKNNIQYIKNLHIFFVTLLINDYFQIYFIYTHLFKKNLNIWTLDTSYHLIHQTYLI